MKDGTTQHADRCRFFFVKSIGFDGDRADAAMGIVSRSVELMMKSPTRNSSRRR